MRRLAVGLTKCVATQQNCDLFHRCRAEGPLAAAGAAWPWLIDLLPL